MGRGVRTRMSQTASGARRRIWRLLLATLFVLAAAVSWRLEQAMYLDVRLRQDLAGLAQMPCSASGREIATTTGAAQRLAEQYGLRGESVTLRRISDCVVAIDVDGAREIDLAVVQIPW